MKKVLLYVLLGMLGVVTFIVVAFFGLLFLAKMSEPYSNEFPKCQENEECHFNVSSSNVHGSGNYWHYGYDAQHFYSFIRPESYNKSYLFISAQDAEACQGFDKHDVLTWVACLDLEIDCAFIKNAKDLYENGSTATQGLGRYQGSKYGTDFSCQLPET